VWLIATAASGWLLITRHGPDWGGLSPLVLMPAALVLEAALLSHQTRPEAVATTAALVLSAWAVGEGTQARSRALAAERSAQDLRAAADERARIARELHDIVAHHVSVISLQAGTARLLAESGTAPDAELLAGIENASRQAMAELRQALGVIRHTPDGTTPHPGLSRIPELASTSGAGGNHRRRGYHRRRGRTTSRLG
jgi:signal transduction histidine kinase